jgi:phosphonate transport system substrate-binding protein
MNANKNLIFQLLFVSTILLLNGCEKTKLSEVKNVSSSENDNSLTFIVHPYDNPSRLVARFTPLCDYLGSQIGLTVKFVVARSYVDQIRRIANGDADLAYMGPTPFLRAQDHYLKGSDNKLFPLAAEVRFGSASYKSVIVVRSNSKITSVEKIANHTFAFGAPHSFSSHYVPRILLGNAGLSFSSLQDFAYLGRHERVALSVLHGDFDAGGLNENIAMNYKDRNPGLRILATSPSLPPHLIVARPNLDKVLIQKIANALVNPNKDNLKFEKSMLKFGKNISFSTPNMLEFDNARKVIMAIESTPVVAPTW